MNLNSREIRRLHINSLSNRRCHKRRCRCCLNCLLLLRRRESVCTFDHQSFCSVVLCALHSFVYSFLCRSFSLYCLSSGHLLKFRNLSKLSERQAPALVIKISKKSSPQRCRLSLCFETKRNTNKSSTKTSTQRASNIREELGTMSKNNLRRITLAWVKAYTVDSLSYLDNLLLLNQYLRR